MKTNRKGSSLILIMIIVAVITGASATVYTYTANQSYAASKTVSLLKARSISEAGITLAYAKIKDDINLVNDNWDVQSLDGGTYQINIVNISSNLMKLSCDATYNGVRSKTTVDLHYYPSSTVALSGANNGGTIYGPYVFNYALYINGTCDWKGCGTFSGGNVYVGGLINLGGNGTWKKPESEILNIISGTKIETSGSAEITCTTAKAPIITQKKDGGIIGTVIAGPVNAPTLPIIELSPFYEMANRNNLIKNGSFSVPNGYEPVGGVLWCNGTIDFKGTAKGCFIATSGITMEAGANVQPVNPNWPTIYNKSGDIVFAGQAETHGFVYAGGDVKFTGGGALQDGPVIIMGSLRKEGNSDMTDSIPSSGFTIIPPVVNPQQISNTLQRLVITGWQ